MKIDRLVACGHAVLVRFGGFEEMVYGKLCVSHVRLETNHLFNVFDLWVSFFSLLTAEAESLRAV